MESKCQAVIKELRKCCARYPKGRSIHRPQGWGPSLNWGLRKSGGGRADKFHCRCTEFAGPERCKEICKWTGQKRATESSTKVKDRQTGGEREGEVGGPSIIIVNMYIVLFMCQALS